VPAAAPAVVRSQGCRLSGSVLLVEDSMIIAMDAEEMLLALGAERVQTGSDVAEALRLLDLDPPTFALLDVNLGDETSLPVADRLRERGIPYMFATGYGEAMDLPPEHHGVVVVKKPYTAQDISAAAARVIADAVRP
jgi:CheY-like chemotaxis protein